MTDPTLTTRGCRWISVPGAADERGQVNFLAFDHKLGFAPRRLFWLHHIAPGQWRGRHGHRESHLVTLMPERRLQGSSRRRQGEGDGGARRSRAGRCISAPWVWHELTDFAPQTVILVIASTLYDEAEYLRDYEAFKREAAAQDDMIPFLDMKSVYAELKPELDAAYARVMESGWFVLGKEVEAFEAEYAAFCGTRHCVGLGNGLEALELVLRAWDLGPGDEVIVPSNTYIATWLAVTAVGATVVPVEPTPAGPNIDPDRIAAAITPRTRAIMPVHLYGEPADMDAIMALADQHGIKVIEDVAQAQGAKVRGRRAGAHRRCRRPQLLPDQEHRRLSATAARSPPTMPSSPSGCACCATTAAG